MKKIIALILIALVAFAAVGTGTATAQDAPKGTWLGTWPYAAPGTHNLNSFATGGLNDNLGLVYRPLVELTPAYYLWASAEYTPMLAEKWGFTADNSAYEYTLKAGAKWSNGDAITTTDVVNTFALGRLAGWSVWSSLAEVVAVDDLTARFVFQEGKASLLAERQILKEHIVASKNYGELAAAALELFKAGKTKDDQEWKDLNTKLTEFRPAELIASGPYTYALSDVGEAFMTLKWHANSLFSGSVKFGDLKLWAGETEQTTPLILSGELAHSTNVYPPATVESFVQAGIRLVNTPRGYGPVLLFNFKVAPFDKKEIRQAMAYVINREQSALLTNGTGASGTVYMSGILDSQTTNLLSKETIDQLNRYPNDLKKAEELMTAAGFTRNAAGKWAGADGKTIAVEYTFPADFADFSAAARDATAQLNEFGFDITERALPWQEARDAIRAGNFALSVWSWGAGSPFAFSHLNNPIRRWTSVTLPADQPGLGLDITKIEYNGEVVNLDAAILNVDAGLDTATHKANAAKISLMLNDLMLYIPLNEMLSVEPLNEKSISGGPADGDPIYQNPSNDHFIVLLILNGTLGPVN